MDGFSLERKIKFQQWHNWNCSVRNEAEVQQTVCDSVLLTISVRTSTTWLMFSTDLHNTFWWIIQCKNTSFSLVLFSLTFSMSDQFFMSGLWLKVGYFCGWRYGLRICRSLMFPQEGNIKMNHSMWFTKICFLQSAASCAQSNAMFFACCDSCF